MIRVSLVRIVLYALLSLALPASAAVTPFTATHTYVLGDDDSRNTARQKCLAEAKRKILEQVGVYLESHSELLTSSQSTTAGSAKSPQTTNEERQQVTEKITTLTAGLMRTEVTKEEFGEVNGRLQITMTLKAEVDPDDIQKQLAARRFDQGVRNQVTEQAQRLAQLEEQLLTMMEQVRPVDGSQPRESEQPGKNPVVPDVAEIRARANKGDAQAQIYLGVMYEKGQSVPRNYQEALKWYRNAAAQGYAMAQYNMGVMYMYGKGVPQDDVQAVAWYRKAAEQGYAPGQYNLGAMYMNGRGVPQSDTEAVAWYRKAAAQGNAPGQTNLGWMYQDGRGVPRDAVKAHMWGSLAVLNGEFKAGALCDEAAKQMTPSQLSQAQRLAQQCRASNYNNCD